MGSRVDTGAVARGPWGQDGDGVFSPQECEAVYRAIFARRDVRRFRPGPVPAAVLYRVLEAAHHAGSVGFMQPWNFLVITDAGIKARVHAVFLSENRRAAQHYRGRRRRVYDALKLEGILDAPVNLCVTCDRERGGPHVLGRNTIRDTDLFSTCCAIQNLWLAARAEGVGVGWVSILDTHQVRRILAIPDRVLPVAYLCVGYPERFVREPELQTVGWRSRIPLGQVLFHNRWGTGWNAGQGAQRGTGQGARGGGGRRPRSEEH